MGHENGNDTSYHWSTWSYQKGLETYLGRIPGQLSISELQKITLLGTAHIEEGLIKLKTDYPLVPQDHGLVSALGIACSAGVFSER